MKQIIISTHALQRMIERGIERGELESTIRSGERIAAGKGRIAFRKNFPFEAIWKKRYYEIKQVMPIVAEEEDALVVITIYAFY